MKEIKISKGYTTFVDDEEFERLNSYKWHAYVRSRSRTVYVITSISIANKKHKNIPMHRMLMGVTDPKIKIDHSS